MSFRREHLQRSNLSPFCEDMPDEPVRVLVVDDDVELLTMVRRYLTSRGFEVITSHAPFDVPRLMTDTKPNALVLDLMMPGLDGSELARFARLDVPVVFFSAADDLTLGRIEAAHPRAHVVSKGCPLALLEETIRSALALGVSVEGPPHSLPA